MHYRHSFHAGNFADVLKHLSLCALLQALNRKPTPWAYLETHAGAGSYPMSGAAAQRTGEWQDGIGRLWPVPPDAPALLRHYESIIASHNSSSELKRYPGSPLFAAAMAREQDRLHFCEKVDEVADALALSLQGVRRATIHRRDGYEAHALLPLAQKRGLLLVDPPFERRDEFTAISDFLQLALQRFAQGTYAAWYPLKNRHETERFERRMARTGREGLIVTLTIGAAAEGQMRACKMLILNPPYRLAEDLEPALRWCARRLAQGPQAGYELQELRALA